MTEYNYVCKICNSQNFQNVLKVRDYTVSRETFDVCSCGDCSFTFTKFASNRDLGYFYQSEAYISHTNSSTGLFNTLYQLVRNYTLSSKARLIARYIKPKSVFDYGCGTGQFLKYFMDKGVCTFGVEVSDSARLRSKELGLEIYSSKEDFDQSVSRETFDLITLWHVLEHVEDLNETITFLKSKMSEISILLIAVPNHKSLDAKIYAEYWAAYDVPRHLYHFDPNSMGQLLAKHDLKIIVTKPMWFDSFYVSMLSEKYKKGKINYIKAAWNGLRSNWNALLNKGECSSQIYIIKKI